MRRTRLGRALFFFSGDAALILFSFLAASRVHPEGRFIPFWPTVLLFLIVRATSLAGIGQYRFTWSFFSLRDLLSLLKAQVIGTVVLGGALLTGGGHWFSQGPWWSFLAIETLVSFSLVAGFRLSKRLVFTARHSAARVKGRRALIVGAGGAGEQILRSLQSLPSSLYGVVGFIDDHPAKRGRVIHGAPVLGTREDIPRLVEEYSVEMILIAIPTAGSEEIRRTVEMARRAGVKEIRTVPTFSDLVTGRVGVSDIRELRLEDVLGREPVHLDTRQMEKFYHGKTVLVTGAAGSIGSELCRQICRFSLKRLVAVDIDETGLFWLQKEIPGITSLPFVPVLGNIQDRRKMQHILREQKPQVVLHAAAFKHVGMMENYPEEAIKNNVFGTWNLGVLAVEEGVERLVLISTDKAVNPRGVMGASKRVAELVGQFLNGKGKTRFCAVRFGNVLGSRGSVLPVFQAQLKKGGPLTITHPEMKRYFMIPSEAALLVLEAAVMGEGGEVFVLDMGQPVKILDLAKELIRLANLEPYKDIPIVFTRPGPEEKLFEDILMAEEGTVATDKDRIFRARVPFSFDRGEFEANLKELVAAAENKSPADIQPLLQKMVAHYQPADEKSSEMTPAVFVSGSAMLLGDGG